MKCDMPGLRRSCPHCRYTAWSGNWDFLPYLVLKCSEAYDGQRTNSPWERFQRSKSPDPKDLPRHSRSGFINKWSVPRWQICSSNSKDVSAKIQSFWENHSNNYNVIKWINIQKCDESGGLVILCLWLPLFNHKNNLQGMQWEGHGMRGHAKPWDGHGVSHNPFQHKQSKLKTTDVKKGLLHTGSSP